MYEIWRDGVLETTKTSLVSACMTAKASAREDRRTYEVYRVADPVTGVATPRSGDAGGKQKVAAYSTRGGTLHVWMG